MKKSCPRWLRKAARLWGLQPDYTDYAGKVVKTSEETLKSVLNILAGQEGGTKSEEDLLTRPWKKKFARKVPPVVVLSADHRLQFSVFVRSDFVSATSSVDFEITVQQEQGGKKSWQPRVVKSAKKYTDAGQSFQRWHLSGILKLSIGYHQLEISMNGEVLGKTLLVVPPAAPSSLDGNIWGLFTPLYAAQGHRSAGLGDLEELKKITAHVRSLGGSYVGTLPLLATAYEGAHKEISPYAPSSRLFWNEVFLSIQDESLPKNSEAESERLELQASEYVDYEKSYAFKKRILKSRVEEFFAAPPEEFLNFLNTHPLVESYAEFRAQGEESEKKFHLYCQYQFEKQILPLKDSLYLDFPVGCHSKGFDATVFADRFCSKFSVGAPPDLLFKEGQNWGFHPFHPESLREGHYDYLIQALRAHMRYCRFLRLDHVMALKRLYVIPEGKTADAGVYLRFAEKEMFAVLAIEAERHGVQVIGENLGTVPESIQTDLRRNNFFGMWVAPFELQESLSESLAKIEPKNLLCLNTHDMVPWEAYLRGDDLESLHEMGLLPEKKLKVERLARKHRVQEWQNELLRPATQDLHHDLLALMAQSPGKMLLINIEDLWQETKPQNIPGTVLPTHWRKKLRYETEAFIANAPVREFLRQITLLRKEHYAKPDLDRGRSLSL